MAVRNKWNNKKYLVLEITGKNVTLRREDGSQFAVQKSEYFSVILRKVVDELN